MKPKFVPDPISRSAKGYRCPKCHAFCMRGLDDEICAGLAVVDSRPLSAAGELWALLEGRATYDLAWRGSRYEIDFRYVDNVKGYPPGSRASVDVVCEHRCGKPITCNAARLRGGPRVWQASISDEECPF
jgi:hypothetical protein